MSESFAAQTKNDLCGIFLKHPCCKKAFVHGALLGGGNFDTEGLTLTTEHAAFASLFEKMLRSAFGVKAEVTAGQTLRLSEAESRSILSALGYGDGAVSCISTAAMRCEYDRGAFLRGVFLACGTVSMPDASYHLELMPENGALTDPLYDFLCENGLEPKRLKRASRRDESLYYKDSEAMEDFLNFIGAQRAAFRLMNVKIMKDLRNNANRLANCDMANIDKTIAASTKQMEAIFRIVEEGRADELPKNLRQTFDLRAAYPDVNLNELAAMHEPPLSKSGVSHRLAKIIAFAQEKE